MVTEDFMKSGNLFDYATSELSQDAFVCWLCSHWNDWDDTVRDASQNLLHAMLESDDSAPVKVLQICRQRFNVDVAVLAEHADTRTVLIVEDKTGSMEHNDQLRRYRDGVDRLFPGEPYDAARVIYYKTGSLVEYSRVKDLCDRVLGLDDILHFIGTPGTESHNAILAEYVAHLQQLQERRNMWDVVPIGDWDDNARAGYAEHLYRRITAAGWSGWGVFEKPNTQNGGHWVVSLGEERELGVRRLKTFIGIEFPPDNIHPNWLLRILVRLNAPKGEAYNRHDCGLPPINDRSGFTSRHSPVSIIGLIDMVPDTSEGQAMTGKRLDAMVDAAIKEYLAWCSRNLSSDE